MAATVQILITLPQKYVCGNTTTLWLDGHQTLQSLKSSLLFQISGVQLNQRHKMRMCLLGRMYLLGWLLHMYTPFLTILILHNSPITNTLHFNPLSSSFTYLLSGLKVTREIWFGCTFSKCSFISFWSIHLKLHHSHLYRSCRALCLVSLSLRVNAASHKSHL